MRRRTKVSVLTAKATPSPRGFTSPPGQQLFLEMVRQLAKQLEDGDLREALFGPWTYQRPLPVMGWDMLAGERNYALRATDPSGDKKTGVPGADWLAFRSLPLFSTALKGKNLATTGFRGRGKRMSFHWLLWEPPVELDVARSLLSIPAMEGLSSAERAARGIAVVLSSRVRRTDQGGYGSFTAASVQ